jgi:hypothetical protein
MRFAEILNELTYGKVGPSVSTIDRSAPWVQKNIKISSDRTRKFNELQTAAEKLEFLYNETDGFTKNKSIKPVFLVKNVRFPFKSFDPSTGKLVLKDPSVFGGKKSLTYTQDIADFEYDSRFKSASSSTVSYLFKTEVEGEPNKEDNPNFDVANPQGRKSADGKIGKTSSDFKKRANDPFSEPAGDFARKANNPFGI